MDTRKIIEIDGSAGEGGGQVLRSSLSCALITGKAVHLRNIRGRRKRPGLLRQHLTAVHAAAAIGRAEVQGALLHSSELLFVPRGPSEIVTGEYRFAVGTAGSATLVLQTILLPLLLTPGHSRVVLEGGTHNPFAPPFEYLAHVYIPGIASQ